MGRFCGSSESEGVAGSRATLHTTHMPLRVTFDPPDHSWLPFHIKADDQELSDAVSAVPSDPILELLSAILLVGKGVKETRADWHLEPTVLELLFARDENQYSITVTEFADLRKRPAAAKRLFHHSGSFSAICRPFWKGLRDLQTSVNASDFEKNWPHRFPQESMDRLSDLMHAMKRNRA